MAASQVGAASSAKGSEWFRLLPWSAALISAAAYAPILGSYFLHDDFNHLYNIANKGFWHFVLTPHGGHAHCTRNVVFYSFYRFFGLDPRPYFASALLTHALNVYLLCRIIELLTEDSRLAFVGGVLWGTCRANEQTIGWYSVYGQALATLLTLWVLFDLLRSGRTRISMARIVGWCALQLVSLTCFGTGIGTALAFPVMVFLLLAGSPQRSRATLMTASLFVTVPALYFALVNLYATLYGQGGPVDATILRPHNFDQLVGVLKMLATLIQYGIADLFLSLYATEGARELPLAGHVVGAVSIAAIVMTFAFGTTVTRRRIAAFGVAFLATYGIIAFGRAVPVLVFFGRSFAWGAAEPRYHYTTVALFSVILCLTLHEARRVPALRRIPLRLLLLAFAATNPLLRLPPGGVIDQHVGARTATIGVLNAVDAAVRSAPPGQTVLINNRAFAWRSILVPPEGFPGWAAVFMIAHSDNVLNGHPVRFVEHDPKVLEALRAQGGRVATLIVGPGEPST